MLTSTGGTRMRSTCWRRSEEHTSELQSRLHLVCRLLLEKKNTSPEDRNVVLAPCPQCLSCLRNQRLPVVAQDALASLDEPRHAAPALRRCYLDVVTHGTV